MSADQGGAYGHSPAAGDNATAVRQARSLYLLFNPKKATSGLSMARPPVPLAAMSIQSAIKSPLSVGRQRAVLRRFSGTHLLGVSILTAFIAALYSVFSLIYYIRFREASYDLVIFDQAIRSYSHFHVGISVIKGVHNGFGPHFSVLGDHFSPILATLAPLYWLHGGPQTLLIAQALLLALAIPPLWVFTRRAFGGGRKATVAAYFIAAAYGLSWPLAAAAAFDFHEAAFAPVLTAIALERIQASSRLRGALIALGALLLVKEDMGLLVFWDRRVPPSLQDTNASQATHRGHWLDGRRARIRGDRRLCTNTGFRREGRLLLGLFRAWQQRSAGSVFYIIRHPLSTFHMVFKPWVKGRTIRWLLAAFAFLPLLSPITLAVVPLLLERMLNSTFPAWWLLKFQYNSFIIMILVCAAVDSAARVDRWATQAYAAKAARQEPEALSVAGPGPQTMTAATPEVLAEEPTQQVTSPAPAVTAATPKPKASDTQKLGTGVLSLALCVAVFAISIYSIFAIPKSPLKQMVHASFYEQTVRTRAATAADDIVPSGVVVEAANDLGPQLSSRDTVLLWDGEHPPLGSSWIVADVQLHVMTFNNVTAQKVRVALLVHSGYKIVFRRDGFIVLHRASGHVSGANS